ncbi:MAG: 50S ribosomal protein L29 [Chloroflexota bacterium]
MKPKEIRDLKPEEIETKLADKRHELMNLRFQQVSGQLTDPSQLRLVRRDIARLETILAEMKSNAAVEGEGGGGVVAGLGWSPAIK